MNIAKTKVMVVDNTPINLNNVLIENAQGYVYLGQHYRLKEKNQDKEIQRRLVAGWAAYAKHRDIFKRNPAICLKRQVYKSCVLPAMKYGAETWTLTKQAQNKLATAQTKMERSMLNITYKENKGVKIDGEFLSNLRFADDIFLCTETPQKLQQMIQELSDENRRMGLKMNIAKTKVMVVDNTTINVNNVLIENVPGYVYLGQHYSLKEKNQDNEIQRRIMAGWAAYATHQDIFKRNLAICLNRQVYNSCMLPAMTYGAETWTLTKKAQNKLAAAQKKMERCMLTYKDRRTNIWVRERTKVIDIMYIVRKMKCSWAGHINRLKNNRWTSRVTTSRPYDKKIRQGRPAKL